MPPDNISNLRDGLKDLPAGPARIQRLTMLAQALADRYWRAGPGQPAALEDLNGAIAAIGEAFGHLEATDPLRGQVAAMYGTLLGARHTAHSSGISDREKAIEVLHIALRATNVPPMPSLMVRLVLGQMHLSRAVARLQGKGFTAATLMSGELGDTADIDQAVLHIRSVVAAGTVSHEMSEVAQGMLTMAEALQDLLAGLRGGLAGLDMTKMANAMAAMQKLMNEHKDRRAGGGFGAQAGLPRLSFFDADKLATTAPIDRPVTVVHGQMPDLPRFRYEAGPDPQTLRPSAAHPFVAAKAPASSDLAQARRSLHDQVRAALPGGDGEPPIWLAAAQLLHPDSPIPASGVVDELVALSTMAVEGPPGEPATAGLDWFLHAVALRLRHRLEQMFDDTDRMAGLQSLVNAGKAIPLNHPAAPTIFSTLGGFLDEHRPLGGLAADAAAIFADRIDIMIATGALRSPAELAIVHAVRCLCRATADDQRDALLRAVGTVPAHYPWRAALAEVASSR